MFSFIVALFLGLFVAQCDLTKFAQSLSYNYIRSYRKPSTLSDIDFAKVVSRVDRVTV